MNSKGWGLGLVEFLPETAKAYSDVTALQTSDVTTLSRFRPVAADGPHSSAKVSALRMALWPTSHA